MTPKQPQLPPFQVLADEHAASVLRFLRGMVGADGAEDALQETLIAALRAYRRFDGENPRAWLLTIARRKAIDQRRSAARRPEPLADTDAFGATPEPARDLEGEVWRAVAELPEKQRAAVVLRFGLDLRYREIGAAIGCSEPAARRNVHEAIARLRHSPEIGEEYR